MNHAEFSGPKKLDLVYCLKIMKPLTKIKYSSIVLDETNYFVIKIKSGVPRKRPVSKNPQHHFLLFFFLNRESKPIMKSESIRNTCRWDFRGTIRVSWVPHPSELL